MPEASVQSYYDNNTRRFLRHGQHDGTRNIHQPLWPAGVRSVEQAVNHSNELLLRELSALRQRFAGEELQVLDLGCGVGASLFYLADRSPQPTAFRGITISQVQAEIAAAHAARPTGAVCAFEQGDFLNLPAMPPVHLAYSIEAFVHARDAGAFFAQAAGALAPGGRLVIIDDVLADRGDAILSFRERSWLADFRSGWFADSLMTENKISQLALATGLQLQLSENLTPYLRLGRPRDKLIGLARLLAGPYMRRSLYLRALSGGYAKQQCIKAGVVQYRRLVFERQAVATSKPLTPARSPAA